MARTLGPTPLRSTRISNPGPSVVEPLRDPRLPELCGGAVAGRLPAEQRIVTSRVVTHRSPDILMVPAWYRLGMAMNLRLSDEESEALRAKAEQEGRSMQEVARAAIAQYVSERPQRLAAAIDRVRTEDRELLERLSR